MNSLSRSILALALVAGCVVNVGLAAPSTGVRETLSAEKMWTLARLGETSMSPDGTRIL